MQPSRPPGYSFSQYLPIHLQPQAPPMSRHVRGIVLHSITGVVAVIALALSFPGALHWQRPDFPRSYQEFQAQIDALDHARARKDVETMASLYARGFDAVEVELPDGTVLQRRLRPFLQQLADQGTILSTESIGPEDAYHRVRVRTPAFDLTIEPGVQHRYRQEWLFSWDGLAWKIVRHRMEPVE